jgi:hypothetical protein
MPVARHTILYVLNAQTLGTVLLFIPGCLSNAMVSVPFLLQFISSYFEVLSHTVQPNLDVLNFFVSKDLLIPDTELRFACSGLHSHIMPRFDARAERKADAFVTGSHQAEVGVAVQFCCKTYK